MTPDQSLPAPRWTVTNARIVTPHRVIERGSVTVDGERITEVEAGRVESPGPTIDVGGRVVLPGLVDLHGDELERHLTPRAGARVDTETAIVACDRANVAAGITTKFHAVAFENTPDSDRSVALAEEVVDAVGTLDGLLADNRINARCELGEAQAVEGVLRAVTHDAVGLVSLMNHFPGCGQFDDAEQFARRYTDGGGDLSLAARRTVEGRQSPTALGDRARRVTRTAQEADIPVASHDVEDERRIEEMWRQGVTIAEYPLTMEAARRASHLGMITVMGAPNLLRGGSLWGNLAAGPAIEAGVVDVLCTDYHPPSLLAAVFEGTDTPRPESVQRVTSAPADAVGLTDRGRIEPGARADLIVVDPATTPRVERAFVGGSEVFRAGNWS